MTQTQVIIVGVENVTTQNGKNYAKIHTNMGVLSCWNNGVAEALKQRIGQQTTLDITQNGNFSTVKGIVGLNVAPQQQFSSFGQAKQFSTGNGGGMQKKQSSFELSYAKDIFCALASGYENSDEVKKDEHLRYLAELSASLILKMRRALDENNGIEEEEVL